MGQFLRLKFVAVSKAEGAIIGACFTGTVTFVMFTVADKVREMTPMKKACIAVSALAGSYLVEILTGVNVCLKAGYTTKFSDAVQISGWIVASAATFAASQFVVGGICWGAFSLARKCNRSPAEVQLAAQENLLPEGVAP